MELGRKDKTQCRVSGGNPHKSKSKLLRDVLQLRELYCSSIGFDQIGFVESHWFLLLLEERHLWGSRKHTVAFRERSSGLLDT